MDKSKIIFSLFFLLIIIFSVSPLSVAETPSLPWSNISPHIDGEFESEEWSDAYTQSIELINSNHDVTFYIKNDDNNIYIGVLVKSDKYSYDDDSFAISFDDNNNEKRDHGEDFLLCSSGYIYDGFFDASDKDFKFNGRDTNDDGNNDISAAVSHSNHEGVGDYFFEFSHPLNSGDVKHDFSLTGGDVLGISFSFHSDGPGGFWPELNEYSSIQIGLNPERELEPENNSTGIPGFPLMSLVIGILTGTFILGLKHK